MIAEVGVSISGMPGPPFGAFVANDDHVALDDFLLLKRREHVFFGIENFRRAFESLAFFASNFRHSSFGGEIAAQDLDVAGFLDWVFHRFAQFAGRL